MVAVEIPPQEPGEGKFDYLARVNKLLAGTCDALDGRCQELESQIKDLKGSSRSRSGGNTFEGLPQFTAEEIEAIRELPHVRRVDFWRTAVREGKYEKEINEGKIQEDEE